jgi:GNAT superfamily N-acetyltransferase
VTGPPPSGLELRALTPDDWATWRDLRLAALADAPSAFRSRLADWLDAPEPRWRDRLGAPGSHSVVAVLDGRPAGMATGAPGEHLGQVELISMWVEPHSRGRGVADALVEEVARWARRTGATTLTLNVFEGNQAARALYERHGFTVVGEAPGGPDEGRTELVMVRQLAGR